MPTPSRGFTTRGARGCRLASEIASMPKLKLPPAFGDAVHRHEREIMRLAGFRGMNRLTLN